MTRGDASPRVLYGEEGYWQHLGEALQRREVTAEHPLEIQIVIPDDGFFAGRSWHEEFDREVRSHLLNERLIVGRVLAPPSALGSPAEPVLDLALESGFEVRVLSTDSRYVIYDRSTAVLSEAREKARNAADGTANEAATNSAATGDTDEHRATRMGTVVAPLLQLFEQQWAAAIAWAEFANQAHPVRDLLALGWTDERIAQELGVSHRTISRRVAAMMASAGAESRFELGMKHGIAVARRRGKRK